MNFNFLSQKNAEEAKQSSSLRGNKVGRNKYGVGTNTILHPQQNSSIGRPRY